MCAMTKKTGFSYYSIDTDRYQDIRIKRLKKDFGCNGIAVYDYILCEIYRVRGWYLEWDENTFYDVADYFCLQDDLVSGIVNFCGEIGLFDKDLLSQGIISSVSIQRRYKDMSNRAKRPGIMLPEKYIILPEENGKIPEKSEKIPEKTDTKRKEKKRKINNPPIPEGIVPLCDDDNDSSCVDSGEKPIQEKPLSLDERKHQFGESLVPYIEKYGKEMIREFFDYWTEANDNGKKMRWEITKSRGGTFSISGRLATWKKRSDNGFSAGRANRGCSISEAVAATYIPPGGGFTTSAIDIGKLLQKG